MLFVQCRNIYAVSQYLFSNMLFIQYRNIVSQYGYSVSQYKHENMSWCKYEEHQNSKQTRLREAVGKAAGVWAADVALDKMSAADAGATRTLVEITLLAGGTRGGGGLGLGVGRGEVGGGGGRGGVVSPQPQTLNSQP